MHAYYSKRNLTLLHFEPILNSYKFIKRKYELHRYDDIFKRLDKANHEYNR